jgi:hypothetical protein
MEVTRWVLSVNFHGAALLEKLLIFPMINKLPSFYGTPSALERNIEIISEHTKIRKRNISTLSHGSKVKQEIKKAYIFSKV